MSLQTNPITSAENARRILVLARVLDIPTVDMLDALTWVDGRGKAPRFIPEAEQ